MQNRNWTEGNFLWQLLSVDNRFAVDNYWSNTNQTIIYWLLHFLIFFSCSSFTWGKKYIHYRRPIGVYNVITRWISVFSGIMTPIIICHQNDNDHDHQWDETLRMIPVASESIRFYISTYSAHYTLMNNDLHLQIYIVHLKRMAKCWSRPSLKQPFMQKIY